MRHYMQLHVRMYVLQVVTGISGNKNEQSIASVLVKIAPEKQESVVCIFALLQGWLQPNEIITLIEMSPFLLIKSAASGQQWKSLVNRQEDENKSDHDSRMNNVPTHDTTRPLKQGSLALSSDISSFTTL